MAKSQQTNAKRQAPVNIKRPLSAYNLFFLVERQRILDGKDHLRLPVREQELKSVIFGHKEKTKRIHRKTHGKIGFLELARTIALRWKNLDGEQRIIYDKQALNEKEKYSENLALWKAYKARQEALMEPLSAEKHITVEDLSAVFQKDEVDVSCLETQAFGDIQESFRQFEMEMAGLSQPLRDSLPFVVSSNEAYQDARTWPNGLFQTGMGVPSHKSSAFSGNPTQFSRGEESLALGSDQEMMAWSPIFKEARLADYDLLEALDSHTMDQLFID